MKAPLSKARSISVVVLTLAAIAVLAVVWNVAGKPFEKPVAVGDKAPVFNLTDDSGHSVSLNDLRGQVIVLSFGSTWCAACRDEDPNFEKVYQDYKAKGLTVLKIDYRETPLVVNGYKQQNALQFPFLFDKTGQTTIGAYSVVPFPTTMILDQQGVVRYRTESPVTGSQLEEQIRPLLGM